VEAGDARRSRSVLWYNRKGGADWGRPGRWGALEQNLTRTAKRLSTVRDGEGPEGGKANWAKGIPAHGHRTRYSRRRIERSREEISRWFRASEGNPPRMASRTPTVYTYVQSIPTIYLQIQPMPSTRTVQHRLGLPLARVRVPRHHRHSPTSSVALPASTRTRACAEHSKKRGGARGTIISTYSVWRLLGLCCGLRTFLFCNGYAFQQPSFGVFHGLCLRSLLHSSAGTN
jgi:hypothetical protein